MDTINQSEEIEKIDEGGTPISVPFNPNNIKISTQPLTLGDLIDRLEHNEINLNTEFQRHPDLWNVQKQSRLIESVLLKLPLPTFYFDGSDDNKWQVIDGLQRISTLKNFAIAKKLKLTNLEFLKDFNEFGFDDLPRDLQRRIKTFPITVYILEKGTPETVKYNVFSRINEGGLKLEPQEIRHALFQGLPAKTLLEMSQSEWFLKATEEKIKTDRMQDRDFINRFVAFYIIGYEKYNPDLDTFMSSGLSELKKYDSVQIKKLKDSFDKSMKASVEIFGNDAFRKRFKIDEPRKPINKALFESISVNLSRLSDEEITKLIKKKEIIKKKLMTLMNSSDRFVRSITQGTAQKETVEERFSQIEKIIKETLSE